MPGTQGAGGAPTMSLGKLSPVGWVSSSQGKRRLTADMISPPLGDFRHTMHVGRGGDVFGDTSFLSNHGGSSGRTHRSPRSFLARKLQQVRRVGALPRRMASPPGPSPAPPAISPIIKNAISLPQLNQAAYDSLLVGKLSFDSSPACSTGGSSSYGLDSGFCTIARLPRQEKTRDRDRDQDRESSLPTEPQLRRSDSLLSFRLDLDLGPSLLSEFLGVMSFSDDPAAETPAPVPTSNPIAPAMSPRPPRGHCPNGVTAGSSTGTGAGPNSALEGPRALSGSAPGRRWGAGCGDSHPHMEEGVQRELVEVLPKAEASWEGQDGQRGTSRGRGPVPSTVLTDTFVLSDREEDDEVKV
ncbi:cdc42 effector protein 1 isoform X1 [Echinops telfairi]|uniref:Cdc42 effector protein 1 isoform X1 n=2 Tax=Echinops telfairi TaxID=9371 RepID=A0AC55DAV7_ECHTE|nr:cdc42 effector protein 1 isoform X1 [Echinops telfairi]XP_045148877.1 cdc42 effector protein 1 isoform X1 [Echinops telfairi]